MNYLRAVMLAVILALPCNTQLKSKWENRILLGGGVAGVVLLATGLIYASTTNHSAERCLLDSANHLASNIKEKYQDDFELVNVINNIWFFQNRESDMKKLTESIAGKENPRGVGRYRMHEQVEMINKDVLVRVNQTIAELKKAKQTLEAKRYKTQSDKEYIAKLAAVIKELNKQRAELEALNGKIMQSSVYKQETREMEQKDDKQLAARSNNFRYSINKSWNNLFTNNNDSNKPSRS